MLHHLKLAYFLEKKVLCSAEKSSVIWAEPHRTKKKLLYLCKIFNWFIFWIYRCSQICLEVASHPGTSGDFNMQCHASTSVSSTGNDNSSSQKTRQNDARSLEAATDVPFYCQFIPFLNNWTSWTPASYNKQHNNVKQLFEYSAPPQRKNKTKKTNPADKISTGYILHFRFCSG